MARPQKDGLDYFPLDVDMDQDDKVELIEAQHGLIGFSIIIKLFMKIYKNSYYYEWTQKEQLLFSKRVNVDINSVNVIINDCINWGLFNKDMLDKEQILTSTGIQKRYLEASSRRCKIKIAKKYLLLNDEVVNLYRNLVIVDINANLVVVNDNIGTQRKEKESKVKETKECVNINSLSLEVCTTFESKHGLNIMHHVDFIKDCINIYGEDWTSEAFNIAQRKGRLNKNYISGILKNWTTEGKPDFKSKKEEQSIYPYFKDVEEN